MSKIQMPNPPYRLVFRLLPICLLALMVLALPADAKRKKKEKEERSQEEAATWDVTQPPAEFGKLYDAEIDVDEGTWLNLDVSPDGQEIIFDMLGDLYTMPITGGDAKALSSGLAWDMQPRYSPNGEWISFTSDRAGGDNIWIMRRDGSDAQQVTKEDFRLLNNAAWSPDGDYLVARKHFTSRRSLGAGEIWLYHRSGGGGLQLTERPNDQKDMGEPVFSVDGRYVFFSQDTTPGQFFQYNKDPNSEIYTIRRLDLESGDLDTYIEGPGGAIRPTPSPDGKYLAFVRRVHYETALFLHDFETGENRAVHVGLERDMQETWAIHGVYANFAWTPDSQAIVFWAGGKIHRLDLASGEVSEIPFRVKQTHRLTEALRVPVEVAPERFKTKMLRWVQVSPTGDQVVFQALGHLYVRDLPDGEARRLTAQSDHFEFYPSFSRDGRSIVYTTWDDAELGTVRVVASSGGEGRVITSKPGHYLEPALSPDGETVIFNKAGGGFLRSPLYGQESGLYRVPTAGGEATRISKSGSRPHFGADSDRVFFMTFESGDKRSLRSIALDRTEERTHLTSEAATEFRISPDGRWVAFTERYNAYLAPFVATGRAIDIGPKTSTIPVRQVSRDAGEYLHWSGDGQTLHWALGPQLYERRLNEAFAFLEGAPEELPEPATTGTDIGFEVKSDVPTGKLALVGGRVITMKGDEVIEEGTVIVDGNRIVAVGPTSEITVPSDATRIDVSGHTLIPGLIDVHWHGAQGQQEITPQQNWYNFSSLTFGVTTIHDPSTDTSSFFAASEMAQNGQIVAPRLYSTGTILYGASGYFKAIVDSLDDAFTHLRRMKAVGAISVKSYNQPRRDQRQQLLTAARDLGVMVFPEGGSLFQHNMTMIVDGHTGIEHAIPVANMYDDVLQLWSQSKTGYTPTLVVGYGGWWGENYWYEHTNVWENERLTRFLPPMEVEPRSRRRTMIPEEEYNHIDLAEDCKALTDVGVSVQLGAHGQREGLAAHWELWMFGQGGMTPLEALRAATLNGAWYIGMDADLGSIEVGKLADIAILEKNPLDNIRHSETVRYTLLNGRLYDAKTLNEVGNHPSERKAFYWEK